jgi:hypothetical protein
VTRYLVFKAFDHVLFVLDFDLKTFDSQLVHSQRRLQSVDSLEHRLDGAFKHFNFSLQAVNLVHGGVLEVAFDLSTATSVHASRADYKKAPSFARASAGSQIVSRLELTASIGGGRMPDQGGEALA